MIKLLVSSFFNTLIDEEDAIPTSTMFEIDRIRQTSKFAIITNRLEEDVLYYNRDYPFLDYVISLNGSIILNLQKNKKTYLKSFSRKELEELKSIFPKKKIGYYTEKGVSTSIPIENVYKVEISLGKQKKIEVPKLNYKITIFQRNKEYFLEIGKNTPYDAIKEIQEQEKIKNSEILGIIGNDCEKPLIRKLENIYVVHNASKELKTHTTKLTDSNKNKGVERIIKKEIK